MTDYAACKLSTYTASDGENLVVQDWPLPARSPRRGMLVVVHGLGGHVGRYDPLAQRLNAAGWDVCGYDQYGHGESAGPRGGLTHVQRLTDDLSDWIENLRARLVPGLPIVLLGHSLGGLVAATCVAQRPQLVDALVLSSPAFDSGLGPVRAALVRLIARCAPHVRVRYRRSPLYKASPTARTAGAHSGFAGDSTAPDSGPAVLGAAPAASSSAPLHDPLCHDRISLQLARFVVEAGPAVLAQAPQWKVPTLLLWAHNDVQVRAAGSAAFAAAAPPAVVQSQAFEGLAHELFSDVPDQPDPVLAVLLPWLSRRFPMLMPVFQGSD